MNPYIELETLELKEKYTDTITKEIVSFLNGAGDQLLFSIIFLFISNLNLFSIIMPYPNI